MWVGVFAWQFPQKKNWSLVSILPLQSVLVCSHDVNYLLDSNFSLQTSNGCWSPFLLFIFGYTHKNVASTYFITYCTASEMGKKHKRKEYRKTIGDVKGNNWKVKEAARQILTQLFDIQDTLKLRKKRCTKHFKQHWRMSVLVHVLSGTTTQLL